MNHLCGLTWKSFAVTLLCCVAFLSTSWAEESDAFTVKSITIKGLHKIHRSTVRSNLGIKVGDKFSSDQSTALIKKLYKTNFFESVDIERQGDGLVVKVKERPVIAEIQIQGNKDISKQRIETMLKRWSVQRGLIFDRSVFNKIEQGLKSYYVSRGKFDTKISTKIKRLSQNRVSLHIDIKESKALIVRSIHIVGNVYFSESQLLKLVPLTTPGLFTYFSDKDKYTEEKLNVGIEALRNFYFDQGYIRFNVVSKTTAMTPDKEGVHITIKVSEGLPYTIRGYQFSGKLIATRKELAKALAFKPGELFSRSKIERSIAKVNDVLAEKGHSFSTVDVNPDIDDKKHTVNVNFFVEPGRPVYVRKINFTGNHKTADYALRRVFRQHESELLSNRKMQESIRQLRLMTFVDDVKVQQKRVPGHNNQVDLDVEVVEGRSIELSVAAGYGTNGFEINAGANDYNFLGTGSTGGINYSSNSWGNNYSINYYNPYYTDSGIGRGFNIFYSVQKPGRSGFFNKVKVSPYSTDRYGVSVNYNIPFSDNHSMQLSLGYESMKIKSIGASPSVQLSEFVRLFGKNFSQVRLGSGWTISNYDQLPFPTKGYRHSIDGSFVTSIKSNGLRYYKLGARSTLYQPLFKGLVLQINGTFKYGGGIGKTKILPFFENYYAGGIDIDGKVRGYDTASLGPRDSTGNAMGGNMLVSAGAAIILPKPFASNELRTKVFLDAGNVYQTRKINRLTGNTGSGRIRLSAGVAVEWRTPLGPLAFSLGFPLNIDKRIDKREAFQFTISQGF